MFTNDYVMRMIELFVRAVAKITGLRKDGEKEEAYILLQDTIKGALGVNADTVDGLDYDAFVTIMAAGGDLSAQRYLLLSELMRIKGEMAREEGREQIAAGLLEKALCLYLAALEDEPALAEQPLHTGKMEQLQMSLQGYRLTERAYAMLARWHERLGRFSQAEDALYRRMEVAESGDVAMRETMDFYERLLTLSPASLERGNLPLEEVAEARERLKRQIS